MRNIIDAKGLTCPQPVINTKKALEEIKEGILTVIVDNVAARDNVRRFAESQGCTVMVEEDNGDYRLEIAKGFPREVGSKPGEARGNDNIVIYINSDVMGVGDEELGKILMDAFLKTMIVAHPQPRKLIFVNSGVRLAIEGSDVVGYIKEMEKKGVEVLSCGTCLNFYGLKEKLGVGVISNMYDIIESLTEADKVISP
ncbi:MAG: sulfurtransferase-like selenium metabolism protein YedF [Deltaproteobacteria bacterium]|jgi:selenium metabolism protein YedF|nr:MAG: sulfurtransferase-like selenium metabolism protein YedF [Deltaproteobacteria bacterium]